VATLDPKRTKSKKRSKTRLDSIVGSSDLLGGSNSENSFVTQPAF